MSDANGLSPSLSSPEAIAVKSQLYGLIISFTILSFLTLVARLYVRIKGKNYGIEDWLVVAAMVMLLVKTALNAIMIENGLGLRAAYLEPANFEAIARAIYVAMIEYCLALGFIKISILIMLRRIFDTNRMRICCNILGIITVIWTILFLFLGVFQCIPVKKAWIPTVPGQCLNINALFIGNAIPNIITDVVMVALPIYPVYKLSLPLSQRIAVICIFLLGSFVCIASIYRLTTVTELNPADIAFTLRGATIFGHVETAVAIMSACLPTLRPLFSAFLSAIGVSKGTASDKLSSGRASPGRTFPRRASSSASNRGLHTSSGKSMKSINKKDIFVVIGREGPRLSTKPLPPVPERASLTPSGQVRNAFAIASNMGPYSRRRDADLERGSYDSSPISSQLSPQSAKGDHVADQIRR